MVINRHSIQRLALYFYLFSLNFEVFNLWGLGSTARFTGVLYLAAMVPDIKRVIKTRSIRAYLRPVFLLWSYLTLISMWHINSVSADFLDTTMLLNILLFWVLLNHERMDPGILQKGMLGFGFGTVFLTMLYYMGLGIEITGGRISIFGDNENAISLRLSMAILVLLYAVIANNLSLKKWRFILLVPAPAMLYFMLNTGSRTAFIGFALAFLVGSLLFPMRRRWHKVVLLVLAAGMALFILQALEQSDVLVKRLRQTTEQGSLGGREEIWASIWPLIKSNPIFGVGQTGYGEYADRVFGGEKPKSPHNVLLEVMAYTGIIGLALYLTFWWRIGRQAIKGFKLNGFLLPVLLLIPVGGMILAGQALGSKIVWAICALAASTLFHNHRIPRQPYRLVQKNPPVVL